MKNIILALVVLLFFDGETESQVVKGKIVDENQTGLAGIELKLYIEPNIQTTTTTTNGSFTFQNVTEVEDERLPIRYAVSNNFPNPFNPSTTISFVLPEDGNVTLKVYDLLGRAVAELVNGTMKAGSHETMFDASKLPSGVYFYKLDFGGKSISKKFVLTK